MERLLLPPHCVDAAGRASGATTVNCGMRVLEGRHRAYRTDFIRDARAGGCTAGTPPSNLGFRLGRDEAARSLADRLRRFIGLRG